MKLYFKEKKKDISKYRRTSTKICLFLSVILIIECILTGCTASQTYYDIMCVYLDAGQGDSSLIMTNDGYTVMIDTGAPGSTDKIVSSLLFYGVEKIDLLILTHFHEDHVAGAVEVLENFNVKELWCIQSVDNYITRSIESAVKENKTSLCYADRGDIVTLGDDISLKIEVLCAYAEGDISDENENSLIVSASYLDFSALFMADAGIKTEEYLLENHYEKINSDILKVGHHGSDSSSSEEFIKAVDPQIAVISCEKNNPYGHPHADTLNILDKYCDYTVFTYDGNFEVFVKGGEIFFEKED